MNRNAPALVLGGILVGIAAASLWPQARAQEAAPVAPPVAPANGRYQLSVIPGAAYMVDTQTGDVYVREYQTKRWGAAGNPLKK